MSYTIDSRTYNKPAAYPVGHGYSVRPQPPTSVVVHSTEGAKGQSLSSAASYIYTSANISADFLIGKAGEIIQFLDSRQYQAWHAGEAQPAYANTKSIGVELLHANGESWPPAQVGALEWLLEHLMRTYGIAVSLIDTHGQVALPGPYQRKIDPTNWPHADFIAWRDTRLAGVPPYARYEVVAPCAVLTARRPDAPLAAGPDDGQTRLSPGDTINVGDVTDGWAWVSDGPDTPPGIGFLPMSYARPL